jgi:hypothetical protein
MRRSKGGVAAVARSASAIRRLSVLRATPGGVTCNGTGRELGQLFRNSCEHPGKARRLLRVQISPPVKHGRPPAPLGMPLRVRLSPAACSFVRRSLICLFRSRLEPCTWVHIKAARSRSTTQLGTPTMAAFKIDAEILIAVGTRGRLTIDSRILLRLRRR